MSKNKETKYLRKKIKKYKKKVTKQLNFIQNRKYKTKPVYNSKLYKEDSRVLIRYEDNVEYLVEKLSQTYVKKYKLPKNYICLNDFIVMHKIRCEDFSKNELAIYIKQLRNVYIEGLTLKQKKRVKAEDRLYMMYMNPISKDEITYHRYYHDED